jgi:methylmalonyl-CoA mutase, N-terminal domain
MEKSEIEKIIDQELIWRQRVNQTPGPSSLPLNRFVTSETELKSLYTPLDLENIGFDYLEDLSFPGVWPYTRSSLPNGYLSYNPILQQYAGHGSAEETNKRWKYLIEQGATSLVVAMDLPTQCGYDSDHPLAAGEVGRVGVPIDSLQDIEQLFDGIGLKSLAEIGTTANAIPSIWYGWIIALCEKRRENPGELVVWTQNEILKEYIARGAWIFPPDAGLKITVDVIEYATRYYPKWEPLILCGSHMRGLGATAIQESAFTLANGLCYIDESVKRGLKPEDVVRGWWAQMGVQCRLIEEVARLRAMRRLWAKLLGERYDLKDPKNVALRLRTHSSGVSFTRQQPLNNIVRGTIEMLIGFLAGGEQLYCHPFGEGWGLPTAEIAKMQLRVIQVTMLESDICKVIDPLGGSYAIETLTNHAEKEMRKIISKIDGMGGMLEAIKNGYVRNEIFDSSYKQQNEIESGENPVVGINVLKEEIDDFKLKTTKIDQSAEEAQIKKLRALRETRDNARAMKNVDRVKSTASKGENLVPSIIEAVRSYATVGEVCGALREIYGRYKQ